MKFGILPKEVVIRWNELTGPAYRVYLYFLTYRNAHDGIAFPGLEMASEELGMNYSLVCRSRKELIKKGWLVEVKKGRFRPMVGFAAVPKSEPLVHFSAENDVQSSESIVHKSEPLVHNSEPVVHKSEPLVHYNIEITDKLTEKGTKKRERTQRKAKPRASRLPDDFSVTDEMRDWAFLAIPDVDIEQETESFLDYFRGVSGSKGTKLDWVATWRNWMRRSKNFRPTQRQNQKKKITMEDHDAYWKQRYEEEGYLLDTDQAPNGKWLGNGKS